MKTAQQNKSLVTRGWRSNISEALFRSSVVAFSKYFWNVSVRDESSIPAGPCFIYGNHSNNYDPFIINAFTTWGQSTAGVMTMEYLDGHFLAPFFSSVGILGTRKHVPEPSLIRRIFRLLDAGRSVVIYPEGGRRWDGRPAPWIEATVKLFRGAGVPIYPVLTHGSYVGWPRWARYPRPAAIELEVLPAITLDRKTSTEDALKLLSTPISIDENQVEERIKPKSAFRPAVGLPRLLYRDPYTGEPGGIQVLSGDRISCVGGNWTARILPDSRILREDTGETYLTGDLYTRLKALPYQYKKDQAVLSDRVVVKGVIEEEDVSSRVAQISLHDTHLSICHSNKYHVPIEHARYVSTERSDKLFLTLTNGYLSLKYSYGGSALQWYDELVRKAPNIRR